MRPSRLRLENFGPFVGTHEVDFERLGAHGLFLIHGPTGAGKSSVLDALCFALYGESTGDERRGKDVVSTLAPHAPTRVTLEFEHRGGRYRVVRSPAQTRPKRRGSGLKTYQEEARLEDLTGGRVLADGVRAVSAQVAELLRCDARQFRQTVVLPQGEFRRVVTDHASRHRVLANVFATERFRRLADALREKRNALESRSRESEARRRELLAGVGVNDRQAADVHLADLRADEARRGAEREAKEAAKAAAERALTAAEAVRDDFARYDEAARRVAELERREAETRVEEVTLERARRAAGLADARRILEEAERALTEARREAAAAEAAAVRAAGESESAAVDARELEELRPELERRERRRLRLELLEPKVEGAAARRYELVRERAGLAAARERLEAARREAARLTARAEAVGAERAELQALVDQEAEARLAHEEAKRLARDARRHADLRAEAARLDRQVAELAARHDPLERVVEAVTRHAPGLLAPSLAAGEPCPVCGGTEHPAPAPAADAGALNRVFDAFGADAAAMARLMHARDEASRGAREVAQAHGWLTEGPGEAAGSAVAAAEAWVGRVAHARTRAAALDREAAELVARLASARDEVTAAEADERRRSETVVRLAAELEGALQDLPAEHREPEAFAAALAAARREHDELGARFAAAARRVDDARQAAAKASERLERARADARRAAERAEVERVGFWERLAAAGFADLADLHAAALPERELDAREAAVKAFRDERERLRGELRSLAGKLAGQERPDVAALERALEAARAEASAAEAAWLAAKQAAARVEERLAEHDSLAARDAELAGRRLAARRLADLAAGQVTGAVRMDLETFVLRSIFQRVLAEGNHHLRHMTGGRYRLALGEHRGKREEGLELDVIDSFSGGAARPAHTLSGGEGFLASLALALGLAEVAQRESGAAEHGALFVDEGFGSLDPRALEDAVAILRGLPEAHRMVGVISHVDELKKRVPVQLLVHAGARGSRLEVRMNA